MEVEGARKSDMSLDFWALCPVLDKSLESHQDPRGEKMHRDSGKMCVSMVVSSVPTQHGIPYAHKDH